MPRQIDRSKDFKPSASRALNGIAVIFDLGGFSRFFNQPDVHTYIPRYLNHVTKCVETTFWGGDQFWLRSDEDALTPMSILPIHRKFLGDGALYIWTPSSDLETFPTSFRGNLSNRLWNLQREFSYINRACADQIPVYELPQSIRFGVARGTIYELTVQGGRSKEYIGVCVNLASRLQKYCPGLNFIASARLELPSEGLSKYGYIKVLATKIRGFPKEIIIVDKDEFEGLDASTKNDLFAEL